MARPGELRRPQLAAHLALHDRHQRLPEAIERRPKRVLPIDYGPAADPHDGPGEPLVESVWIEPYPDEGLGLDDGLAGPDARYEQRESIELAFIAALQHLPARQRAVLILRDVLGFSAREVADALETTPASVYSALQRAHKTVDERLPERSQQATLRALATTALRELVDALRRRLGARDVGARRRHARPTTPRSAMPPMPTWYRGRDAVTAFLQRYPLAPGMRWSIVPARASGQPAFAFYRWQADTALRGAQHRGADPGRAADRRAHRVHRAGGVRALRPARRARHPAAPRLTRTRD